MPDYLLYDVLRRSGFRAQTNECMPERMKALYGNSSRVLRVLTPRLDRVYFRISEQISDSLINVHPFKGVQPADLWQYWAGSLFGRDYGKFIQQDMRDPDSYSNFFRVLYSVSHLVRDPGNDPTD